MSTGAEGSRARTTVLIVDDSLTALKMLSDIVSSGEDMRVVATATTGEEAKRRALELEPDAILMDVNLPDTDGIQVVSMLASRLPDSSMIMVTSEGGSPAIRRAMQAGAHAYLTKPLNPETVLQTIRSLRKRHAESTPVQEAGGAVGLPGRVRGPDRRGRRIVIFGAKGGVGKTTISANLSVALRVQTGKEVVAVDADFFFGDLGLHLNVASRATIVDLLPRMADLDGDLLERALAVHASGVRVLLGPALPEQADMIKVEHLNRLLSVLPSFYDYIIVDCQPHYDDASLAVLDHADLIMLVLTPEIGPIRNSKHFLRLAGKLGYGRNRVVVVLNRADSNVGVSPLDVERALEISSPIALPSGGRALVTCVNRGNPLVLDNPRSPWARAILELARQVEACLAPAT